MVFAFTDACFPSLEAPGGRRRLVESKVSSGGLRRRGATCRARRLRTARNLVYTGVTRGKRLVVLVGQRKALAIAVKGSRARRRWSKLREWLQNSLSTCSYTRLPPRAVDQFSEDIDGSGVSA
jgi:hypothetical protein